MERSPWAFFIYFKSSTIVYFNNQRINIRRSIKKVPELGEGAMKAIVAHTSGSDRAASKSWAPQWDGLICFLFVGDGMKLKHE